LLLLLLLLLLVRVVMPNNTSGRRTHLAVTNHVARRAADKRTFDAALSVRRYGLPSAEVPPSRLLIRI
jgi:hypothetical protein